jgi:cyclophilin family peptidyl-prolyl cis-trans isomerase
VTKRTLSIGFLITILLLTALVLAGCGKSGKEGESTMSAPPASTPPAQGQQTGPDGKPVKTLADFPDGQDGANVEAVIRTAKGDIVVQFYPDLAPVTVASFLHLARTGFYNGVRFHRVVPGFVIQGGDPLSKDPNATDAGTGGPGYYLPAEFNSQPHKTGTLSMARSQSPTSGGSQFFICLADQPSLDGQYTVFGQTVSGMDVVNSIAQGDVIQEVIIRPKSGQ